MNKRNLNTLASLVIMLALTGCNESEIDKITLIGRDKSDLAQKTIKPSSKSKHPVLRYSLFKIKMHRMNRNHIRMEISLMERLNRL